MIGCYGKAREHMSEMVKIMKVKNILIQIFELMGIGKPDNQLQPTPERKGRKFKKFSLLKKCTLRESDSTTPKQGE